MQFCRHARLLAGDWVAIDGSKFRADASDKAVYNAKRLAREREAVRGQVAAYLQALDEADEHDDGQTMDPEAVRAALAQLEQRQ